MESKQRIPSRRSTLALIAFGFVAAACATGSQQQNAPVQVDAMVTWIERVQVESDRSKLALADSFERLNGLAGGKFGKDSVVEAYARFVQSIDAAEQQSKRFAETVAPMQESARPVFEQWQADVATIGSERMRRISETRLADSMKRYDAIVKAAVPAQQQMEVYVKSLRDHAAFLAHDLNPSAIDAIQEDVKVVARAAKELDAGLDVCAIAARTFVAQAALPSGAAAAVPTR
jgi:hypothetical protein